ncbi:MAG: biotin carboxylase [Rhodoferax sp.]
MAASPRPRSSAPRAPAARASAAPARTKTAPARTVLRSVADIRRYFAQRERAVYFISATNFNAMGMHRWVRGWHNITLLDCFDGAHSACSVVEDDHSRVFTGIEDINHYLFDHPDVAALLQARRAIRRSQRGRRASARIGADQALFLFFDAGLERRCAELGLELALPAHALVREVDSKIVTTRIGEAAGVASVPNVLSPVPSWQALCAAAQRAGLGEDLVLQSAWGDSGKTTYFIRSEDDYQAVAAPLRAQECVKIMRRVRCAGMAIEACATRWGTVVGPLLTEMTGQPELTPYPGGWCGNENYPGAYSASVRQQVMEKTRAMGDALYARGYRGTFELDFLLDLDSGAVYLGELNPRLTGVSTLTNTSDFCEAHVPLLLFHLLEFDPDVALEMDLQDFNQGVLAQGAQGQSAQLILKYGEPRLQRIVQAPVSGVYRLTPTGALELVAPGVERRQAQQADEGYVLRLQRAGDYAYHGGDMAILFLNAVVREGDGRLNALGQRWTQALRETFVLADPSEDECVELAAVHHPVPAKGALEAP